MAVSDFSAGAMENWGLVIYRETALLYDEAINSASNKQRVAAVVAHELAHQVGCCSYCRCFLFVSLLHSSVLAKKHS